MQLVRPKEHDLKVAKAKYFEEKDKRAHEEVLRIQKLAGTVCERISDWHQQDPN